MKKRPNKFTMDDILEEINEMMRGMLHSRLNAKTPDQPLVWGFSMTQIGDETPEIHEFGNINPRMFMEAGAENQPVSPAELSSRKPLVDILETDDSLHVVVEMPGVTKEDITLECDGSTLDIQANGTDRKYSEHVDLPSNVLPDSAKATHKNGVLEVVFQYDRSNKRSIKLD